jgi:hypothetical protein
VVGYGSHTRNERPALLAWPLAGLRRIAPPTPPALWLYVSTDSDLSGTYFSDGVQRGLKVNDLVIGINTSGNTTKMYRCTALAAFDSNNPRGDRAATLSAGTQISS